MLLSPTFIYASMKLIKSTPYLFSPRSDLIRPPEDSLASNHPWSFRVIPQGMLYILQPPECLPSS